MCFCVDKIINSSFHGFNSLIKERMRFYFDLVFSPLYAFVFFKFFISTCTLSDSLTGRTPIHLVGRQIGLFSHSLQEI